MRLRICFGNSGVITFLVASPAIAGGLSFLIRNRSARRALLVVTAAGHSAMTVAMLAVKPAPEFNGWLMLDSIGTLFLGITSTLFLMASIYAIAYLRRENPEAHEDFEEDVIFSNAPEAVFIGCLLFFLAMMTLVIASNHLGLLWVAMEATTLASAPLIYFHRHHRSLEATWKYLLICSVGIALALLGNFFLAVAVGGKEISMVTGDLVAHGSSLNAAWLKAAFVLMLVGYGTKMGLAPMHTWLPDAHSEAPSIVSALLSGALLNCAFLGILRTFQVCAAAGQAAFAQQLLVVFGLASMAVAAVFLIGQADFKRMLAYSSIENMGILALGVGVGGTAAFGSMMHAVNHSCTKGMLFLVAGNIIAFYKTKSSRDVNGVIRTLPATGILWFAGILAITGMPPFGSFISEFTILMQMLNTGRTAVAVAYLFFLCTIFAVMISAAIRMAHGMGREKRREPLLSIVPPIILCAVVLLMGTYIPDGLATLLVEAAGSIQP